MPRKYKSPERFQRPDPVYNNKLISKFINCLMLDGKKSTAQRVLYDAFAIVQKKISDEKPEAVFLRALDNVKPHIEVRSKRVGGATYQVPMEVSRKRQQSLAIRWMLEAVRKKRGRPIAQRLAEQIIAAYKREGDAYTMRENVHRMAEANKAFAHFAW